MDNNAQLLIKKEDQTSKDYSSNGWMYLDEKGQGGSAIYLMKYPWGGDSTITATISGCKFKNNSIKGDNEERGGAAIFAEIYDGSSVKVIGPSSEFTQCFVQSGNGGSIYAKLDKTGLFQIDGDVLFKQCDAIKDISNKGGRGGSIYLCLTSDSTYNFYIVDQSRFDSNKADLWGRDVFIYCQSIFSLNALQHFLFDIFPPSYNQDNALYGTEQESITGNIEDLLVDY
ncbi:MAG: hypothetical protein EZS28_046814, partial [Streblomastix strix]